jgi:glycerol-3-phosphate cytidylyltransferase-like family protein
MSAITETEPGGVMVCIVEFEARPRNEEDQPVAGKRRRFSIGEHVRYVRQFYLGKPEDNPIGYMAVFEPLDLNDHAQYGATQDNFVGLECWENLRSYFAEAVPIRS